MMFRLIVNRVLIRLKDIMSGNMTDVFLGIRKLVIKTISSIVPPDDIEDIVQETYVKLCLVKSEVNIEYPRSFMLKMAKNLALDHRNKASNRLNESIEELELEDIASLKQEGDPTFEGFATDQEFSRFCEVVRQLPVKCRKVFVLKKVYGYTQKEIAKSLNLSENTVENHIANGLIKCNEMRRMQTLKAQSYSKSGNAK
ncbi:MAG: sigma-70 family RNA polymerase sigma factor [Paraglaciecola sp.]|uniref:sigma-70 family RNA polymerase sigma factor n=1 Tax=Paraglaciecola sp. TaxID=1920173 RepID=UPI00273F095E|nr:sigma-70 family RNA polymerase sigma factor [Paraglaciecola sp.]MDP5029351.1 sigma-70 family RNA polymerase sigma factor [Paraglaciecola sp.]MDP5133466.1 sigma-70 family RNA polymerase sigma factor [Paraglaciecola sp.]